jgi:hypothetical protein
MKNRKGQRRDPLESTIEAALQPGRYIGWNEGSEFSIDLADAEQEIAKLVKTDPARAVALYEAFIAGCTEKAEEVDDSDGEFGMFAGSLFAAGSRRGKRPAPIATRRRVCCSDGWTTTLMRSVTTWSAKP